MMGKRPGFMMYNGYAAVFAGQSNENAGLLVKAMTAYSAKGKEPHFEDEQLNEMWEYMKSDIDSDGERYTDKCEKNAKAAQMRWGKNNGTDNGIDNENTEGTDYDRY